MDRSSSLSRICMTILCLLVAAPVALCQEEAPRFQILCTTFPVHLFTRNITNGCAGVTVDLMLPADLGCPHDYTLTPEDMRRLAVADVLVSNGLGMEEFLGAPVKQANPGLIVVDSTSGMTDLLDEDPGHDHGHEATNPHVFASPRMAAEQVLRIARGLGKADPVRAAAYDQNARAYVAHLQALGETFHSLGDGLRNNRIVTQHGAFDYLARDAGIEVVARVQSHAGQEPSASEMLGLIRAAKEAGVGALVHEPQYPEGAIQTIASETGIPVLELDPVATGPADAPLSHYEEVMRENLRLLKETLGTR